MGVEYVDGAIKPVVVLASYVLSYFLLGNSDRSLSLSKNNIIQQFVDPLGEVGEHYMSSYYKMHDNHILPKCTIPFVASEDAER